jgi:hypothetical protein
MHLIAITSIRFSDRTRRHIAASAVLRPHADFFSFLTPAPPVGGVLNACLSTGHADRTPDAKQDMYVETGSKAMAKKLTVRQT